MDYIYLNRNKNFGRNVISIFYGIFGIQYTRIKIRTYNLRFHDLGLEITLIED